MAGRRGFLQKISGLAAAAALPRLASAQPWPAVPGQLSPAQLAIDEVFWAQVARSFMVNPDVTNLENGYLCAVPQDVLEAHLQQVRRINAEPAWYMRRHQFADREQLKQQLAQLAGVSADEVVITRNATEALEILILGLPMRPGDEAVISDQDYPNMVEAFRMRERREGIKVNVVKLPLHPTNDQQVVDAYAAAITPRTKVMLATHLINLTGQVLPVKQLCDLGRAKGVEVIVDGAHSFAHLDFALPQLGCDYFGTSLHKWLCAPLGAGMLYIKQAKIAQVPPLFGDATLPATDIRKLERVGTQPCANHLAIAEAIRFHQHLGGAVKEARLRYLRTYWAERASRIPGVYLNMPLDPARSSGLGNVGIRGKTPTQIADYLLEKHRVFTVAIDHGPVQGIRVTPHLFTSLADLDKLVAGLKELAG
ncbi:MAG: aminotransferase class V-fold PLP-dependent enzyme [Bernardetiaceae bacterium]|jgi:selenocysteine lyase/cysteine desulfurase|nr:aminotransferase class V-fold PLP-dependent enzyme [Bernardetiaceae bacterium]